MKDLVKFIKIKDEQEAQLSKNQIKQMQLDNKYPNFFEFPLTMQFELTENCNLMCKHCYNSSGIKYFKDNMSVNKWIEFSKYITMNGGIFQCILSGGEPLLLGDNLFKIMDILHDNGTAFILITNGFLLTPNIADKLSKYRFMWLQVSIDAFNAEKHDEFRKVNGSWEKAVKGAYEISKRGIPLTIAHTVTPNTLYDIDNMCDLAYELGASTIIIGEVTPSGRSNENEDIFLSYEQKNIMLQKIHDNLERYQGKMIINRSTNTKLQLQQYQNTPNNGVIIRPNGDIRLDCMTPFTLGNILKDDFKTVWLEKGINCWHHSEVNKFIAGVDSETGTNTKHKNYVHKDIQL